VWRAFELRPEPVPTLDPGGDYLTRIWRDAVYPLAEKLGMRLSLPPVQPRSRKAHETARWAAEKGRFDDVNEEIFRAFFQRGEDIGNVDILMRIVSELGLDPEELRTALQNSRFEADVKNDEVEAANLGIHGIPAFAADRRLLVTGVQTAESLAELVQRAQMAKALDSTFDPIGHLPLRHSRRDE
jgi:predicted DsbA family dithiol-disulfide isomerase